MLQEQLLNIVTALKNPCKGNPFLFELQLRDELVKILTETECNTDESALIKLLAAEKFLCDKLYEIDYVYQQDICRGYLKALKKYIPDDIRSENKQPEYRRPIHCLLIDGKWQFYYKKNI